MFRYIVLEVSSGKPHRLQDSDAETLKSSFFQALPNAKFHIFGIFGKMPYSLWLECFDDVLEKRVGIAWKKSWKGKIIIFIEIFMMRH